MEFQAIIGLSGFAVMLLMVLVGIPIFVSLLSVTFVRASSSWNTVVSPRPCIQFMTAPYARAADYTFSVLPLFMLLGVLAGETAWARGPTTPWGATPTGCAAACSWPLSAAMPSSGP